MLSDWMRLHHSQDVSTYPRYKLMCFVYFSFFRKEQNALAFNRAIWCHLVLCLQMIPPHWHFVLFSHMLFGHMLFGHMLFGHMLFGHMLFGHMLFGHMLFGHMLFGQMLLRLNVKASKESLHQVWHLGQRGVVTGPQWSSIWADNV